MNKEKQISLLFWNFLFKQIRNKSDEIHSVNVKCKCWYFYLQTFEDLSILKPETKRVRKDVKFTGNESFMSDATQLGYPYGSLTWIRDTVVYHSTDLSGVSVSQYPPWYGQKYALMNSVVDI